MVQDPRQSAPQSGSPRFRALRPGSGLFPEVARAPKERDEAASEASNGFTGKRKKKKRHLKAAKSAEARAIKENNFHNHNQFYKEQFISGKYPAKCGGN